MNGGGSVYWMSLFNEGMNLAERTTNWQYRVSMVALAKISASLADH